MSCQELLIKFTTKYDVTFRGLYPSIYWVFDKCIVFLKSIFYFGQMHCVLSKCNLFLTSALCF